MPHSCISRRCSWRLNWRLFSEAVCRGQCCFREGHAQSLTESVQFDSKGQRADSFVRFDARCRCILLIRCCVQNQFQGWSRGLYHLNHRIIQRCILIFTAFTTMCFCNLPWMLTVGYHSVSPYKMGSDGSPVDSCFASRRLMPELVVRRCVPHPPTTTFLHNNSTQVKPEHGKESISLKTLQNMECNWPRW